jgi:hypothetical protein
MITLDQTKIFKYLHIAMRDRSQDWFPVFTCFLSYPQLVLNPDIVRAWSILYLQYGHRCSENLVNTLITYIGGDDGLFVLSLFEHRQVRVFYHTTPSMGNLFTRKLLVGTNPDLSFHKTCEILPSINPFAI